MSAGWLVKPPDANSAGYCFHRWIGTSIYALKNFAIMTKMKQLTSSTRNIAERESGGGFYISM
jgi:hypothetical protein